MGEVAKLVRTWRIFYHPAGEVAHFVDELEAVLRKDVEELRRRAKDSFHNEWPQSGVQIKSPGLDAAADYMERME